MFHNFFWGGMWFGSVFWIVVLALLIWLVVKNINREDHYRGQNNPETALDILKKRYAKGEISKEQFEQMKRDIS